MKWQERLTRIETVNDMQFQLCVQEKEAGEIMAWVSIHDNVVGGKLRELAKEVSKEGLPYIEELALGILVKFWLWGLNNADKNGMIINADKEDIVDAFSSRLVSHLPNVVGILLRTHWIDATVEGYKIHDWDQWQEQWYKAMEKRERDKIRKRDADASKKKDAAVPPSEEPDAEAPPEGGGDPPDEPEHPRYVPAFETFWEEYPRKIDKGAAYKKYMARRRDVYSDEDLLRAAKNYAYVCKRNKTDKNYIKHGKTFLGDSLPFLDYLPKREAQSPETQLPDTSNPFADCVGKGG